MLSLREEVAFLKEETGEGDVLKPVDLEDLRVKIKEYLDDSSTTRDLVIGTNLCIDSYSTVYF